MVVPETVRFPPKYTLPEEWTERRESGVVVPMPTSPAEFANRIEPVALVIFNAGIGPAALETFTDRTAEGEVEAMPTLPSFLTNNNDVEALLTTLKAAVAEVEPPPATVNFAKRPVVVPIPTLPP